MVPGIRVNKVDGQTGVVSESPDGILVIIAPSEDGDLNTPSTHTDSTLAVDEFGIGDLTEGAAYDLEVVQRQVTLIRADADTDGVYSAITKTGTGTSTPTAGATKPLGDYDVEIVWTVAGTRGTPGAEYTESFDGGKTTRTRQLGSATSIVIADTGVTIQLGAGTFVVGDKFTLTTTGPRMSGANLSDALAALKAADLPWDAVLILGADFDDTMIGTLNTWVRSLEAEGEFKTAVCNVRPRTASETEAQYRTAMQTLMANVSTISVVVCADACDMPTSIAGRPLARQRRAVALPVAARGMQLDPSTDPAYRAELGALANVKISDDRGNPKYHDERKNPGLDSLRLTTLRTWARESGVSINNALLASPQGSDYVYWQHARVMNLACRIAYDVLKLQCSVGIHRDKVTKKILDRDAKKLEGLVQGKYDTELVGKRCSDATFTLSRTDDLSSNGPITLTCTIGVDALRYVKEFVVNAQFV